MRVDYNSEIHKPLDKRDSEALAYWINHGFKLRVDENFHVYVKNKWIGDCKPKSLSKSNLIPIW